MQDALGRIIGTSVTHIQFRCAPGKDVYVGDLLVAEDEATGHRYLLRVTDVRYGLEGEADLAPRIAGRMLSMASRGEDARRGFWDADERLYKVGAGVPLGYVREEKFRKAKTLPTHFSPVRRAAPEDYKFLAEFMGDIEVGYLRSGEERVEFPVGIDGSKSFPYHVGVFATTGMGKSNLTKVLAASTLETGKYGLLVIDPHGEYYAGGGDASKKGLVHHPLASRNLSVYAARQLKGRYNKLQVSTHEIEVSDLKQLFDFTDAQKDFLDGARRRYGGAWLADIREKDAATLMAEVQGTRFEGPIEVVKRKIARLFDAGLIHRDEHVTCTKPIINDLQSGRVVLVDSGGLTEYEELLVATVLARAIFDANKRAFEGEGFDKLPPVLITIEEAQRVLGKGKGGSSNVFAQIAREGRKFKTGLCAITQQPKLLDSEVISQFNTLFILGLADKRDRDILQDSAKQDVSQLENEIQMLMPGEVLITSPYAPFAIPGAVHLYEEHLARKEKTVSLKPQAPRVEAKGDFY